MLISDIFLYIIKTGKNIKAHILTHVLHKVSEEKREYFFKTIV